MAPFIPPFPDGLKETTLERIPLSRVLDHDSEIEDQLFACCKKQGFFYLDLTESPRGRSLLDAAERLHDLSEQAFRIPQEEKARIGFDKTKTLFGWKASGIVDNSDVYKRKDVGQFFNVSKDDVLGNPGHQNVPYPSPIKEEIQRTDLFKRFIKEAHSTGLTILACLERKLALPPGTLVSRHRITELAGDHVRLTYGPGDPSATDASGRDEASTRITTTGHTDFGSVTLLFNWLGGLQIESHETGGWEWVRPTPGHAICNLGDAMVEFSGSQLRSGKHRVVAAPGEQARLERYSVVYFVRPEDEVVMENLTDTHTDKRVTASGGGKEQKRWKAGEWIIHRSVQLGNKIPDKDK